MLERLIKNDLYFREQKQKRHRAGVLGVGHSHGVHDAADDRRLKRLLRDTVLPADSILCAAGVIIRELRRNAALAQQSLPWARPSLPILVGYLSAVCDVRGVPIAERELRRAPHARRLCDVARRAGDAHADGPGPPFTPAFLRLTL